MSLADSAERSTYARLEQLAMLGAVVLAAVYAAIVIAFASTGSFYTLDDPFIHMALAENLARGHFGVNLGEVSNPSSSILWPWLLAAFEKFGLMLWAPLLVNIACFVATLRVVLAFCLARLAPEGRAWPVLALAGAGLLAFNVFGVIFTGMEHSLHVLLTMIVVTRAIDGKHDALAFAAMVLSPLVRFEGFLGVAFGAGAALVDRRWMFAAGAVVLSLAMVGGYALWLTSIGLPALPSSVLSKSALSSGVVDGGGGGGLFANLSFNLMTPSAPVFLLLAGLLAFGAVKRKGRDRWLALGMLGVLVLAFLAGKFNGYGRYEAYALMAAGLACVHLFAGPIRAVLAVPVRMMMLCIGLLVVCLRIGPYVAMTTPMAARNIDRQQHQMHRMVTQCWKQPVAINDLGWVSFRNDGYVLDLWGLGNEAARKARAAHETGWMGRLVAEKDVELAILYPDWFDDLPRDWVKVGEIGFNDPAITAHAAAATVFATNPEAANDIRACLEEISGSMPEGAWAKVTS